MRTLILQSTALTILALFFIPPSARTQSDILYIYFLDVGQGEAMLLHQPGRCAVLIDAGPLISGHLVTNKIKELGISELDFVIISHPHLDHFGGLFDLAPRFGIKHFYDNNKTNPQREYFDDYLQIRNQQPHSTLSAGDNLQCGNIQLSVLHPFAELPGTYSINESSLALMISSGTFKLLHMGDVSGVAEESLLTKGYDLNADILKIAHHGAADATSLALLQKASPTHALISAADSNWIEAPSGIVLKRLDQTNITTFRTDKHQAVTITVSEDSYTIVPESEWNQ